VRKSRRSQNQRSLRVVKTRIKKRKPEGSPERVREEDDQYWKEIRRN